MTADTHDDSDRDAAAAFLMDARLSPTSLDGLPETLAPKDLPAAYRLQSALNERLAGALDPVAGWKIGCTTAVMQTYLGIDHPCAGAMFSSGLRHGLGVFTRTELNRPGVECEIAVTLARDLPGPVDGGLEALVPFIASAHASIELVDDRWRDFSAVGTPTLIADNFFNAGCVLGEPVAVDPMHLDRLQGAMRVNGNQVGEGRGADILGHPLEALNWLAGHARETGRPLRAGEVVTLGSLVQTVWLEAGDEVSISIETLGRCDLRIESPSASE